MVDQNEVRILIACMPKSGSTLLARSIQTLPGFRREYLVPGFERREQELCVAALEDARKTSDDLLRNWKRRKLLRRLAFWKPRRRLRRPIGYVDQRHLRYSAKTKELIDEYRLKPVVLVRNIFDVVISIQDHYRKFSLFMSMAYVDERIAGLDDAELQDFIVDMVMPWYFNFFVSWQKCEDCLRVSYDELIADKEGTVLRILEYAGADSERLKKELSQSLLKAEGSFTRKNVGQSGRGQQLSEENKARIRRLASYYPEVDFSSIGLGNSEAPRHDQSTLKA